MAADVEPYGDWEWSGTVTASSFIIGANTLDTTEWAFLDGQDQAVASDSSPTFANITTGGTAQAEHLYTTDDLVVDGQIAIGTTVHATRVVNLLTSSSTIVAGFYANLTSKGTATGTAGMRVVVLGNTDAGSSTIHYGGDFRCQDYKTTVDAGKNHFIVGGLFRTQGIFRTFAATGNRYYYCGYFRVDDATGTWTNNPAITTYGLYIDDAPTGYGTNHTHYAMYSAGGDWYIADGEVTLHGTARVKRHIRVSAPSWKGGSTAPGENFVGILPTLAFDKTSDDSAHYSLICPFRMTAGSTIDVIVDWTYEGAQDNGTVCWALEYINLATGESVVGDTATISKTSGEDNTIETLVRTTLNTGITGAVAHDVIGLRLYRDASADTLNRDAELVQVHFEFTMDKLGKPT